MVTHRNIYRYVYIHRLIYMHVIPGSRLRGPRSNDTPIATRTPNTRYWFLIPSFNKRNQGFWEKCPILELGQEIYKINPEPESKEVLKKFCGVMSKGHKSPLESSQ